jgi:parallel beta-helix repeat protein
MISNNIMLNNGSSIVLQDSSSNRIVSNIIGNNTWNGILLINNEGEWGNQIIGNHIIGNYNGVNSYDIGRVLPNTFYHNSFIDNERQVTYYYDLDYDIWDNGYPSGGNYWSDYTGIDVNEDGIGDTSYVINGDEDSYPLMIPLIPGDADWDGDTDVFDWVKIKRVILGLDVETPGSDVDCDGDVDVFDWVKVKRIILGLDI